MDKKRKDKDVEAVENLPSVFKNIKKEIAKIIVGQEKVIDQLLISLFARGHCLLVGVPGLAKTLMVRTLAKTLSLVTLATYHWDATRVREVCQAVFLRRAGRTVCGHR